MDLSQKSIEELLELASAPIITGSHLVYSSGMHGEKYANMRPINVEANRAVLEEIAYRLLFATFVQAQHRLDFSKPILVVGPETLGAALARKSVETYLARHPDCGFDIAYGFFKAETVNDKKHFEWGKGGGISLLRPHGVQSEAQVIWMDDLMNEGSTLDRTRNFIEDVIPSGITAVAVIFDRSDLDEQGLEVQEFIFLTQMVMESYPAEQCPFCAEGRPILLSLSHGKDYQTRNPNYWGGYVDS